MQARRRVLAGAAVGATLLGTIVVCGSLRSASDTTVPPPAEITLLEPPAEPLEATHGVARVVAAGDDLPAAADELEALRDAVARVRQSCAAEHVGLACEDSDCVVLVVSSSSLVTTLLRRPALVAELVLVGVGRPELGPCTSAWDRIMAGSTFVPRTPLGDDAVCAATAPLDTDAAKMRAVRACTRLTEDAGLEAGFPTSPWHREPPPSD